MLIERFEAAEGMPVAMPLRSGIAGLRRTARLPRSTEHHDGRAGIFELVFAQPFAVWRGETAKRGAWYPGLLYSLASYFILRGARCGDISVAAWLFGGRFRGWKY